MNDILFFIALAIVACRPHETMTGQSAIQNVAPEPKTTCHDNLCGDAMHGEQYCSCHGSGVARRCWSQSADCEVDLACCESGGDCRTIPKDECSLRTADERKKRDHK